MQVQFVSGSLVLHRLYTDCMVIGNEPILVTARSKAWRAWIAGSNASGGMDVCFCEYCVCCQVEVSASG